MKGSGGFFLNRFAGTGGGFGFSGRSKCVAGCASTGEVGCGVLAASPVDASECFLFRVCTSVRSGVGVGDNMLVEGVIALGSVAL